MSTEECPVQILGTRDGDFFFLDAVGQFRTLNATQVFRRSEISVLFCTEKAMNWLYAKFPQRLTVKRQTADGIEETETTCGFIVSAVAEFLVKQSSKAGIFGQHLVIRKPGAWLLGDGRVALHVGDAVIIGDEQKTAGFRNRSEIFAAAAATPRPAAPAAASMAVAVQDEMRELWNFRSPGGEFVLMGLLGLGYYGAAANWRSNGFIIGGPGSGKSELLNLMASLSPLHHFTNDTSKAGIEQALNGRAMAIFVDESSDRRDQRGAEALMDIVLASTGGTGTRGHRGTINGKVRVVEMAGVCVMAAVAPPMMQPQHHARFTIIELMRPESGEDNSAAMLSLRNRAKLAGPALWGRALAGFDRFCAAQAAYRAALLAWGCSPREQDQAGAILAGWWVLTADGIPSARDAHTGVVAICEFIRRSEDAELGGASRKVVDFLTTSIVQLERSTDRESIGELITKGFDIDPVVNGSAARILARYGIRCVRSDAERTSTGKPVPRGAAGDGIWFSNSSAPLGGLFTGTEFEGERWRYALGNLESARKSPGPVRFGTLKPARATWVSRADIVGDANDP